MLGIATKKAVVTMMMVKKRPRAVRAFCYCCSFCGAVERKDNNKGFGTLSRGKKEGKKEGGDTIPH